MTQLKQMLYASPILTALLLSSVSYAANDVDSITVNGDSHITEIPALTSMIVTVAELAEDWLFPVAALLIAGLSLWRLWSHRDFTGASLGIIASVGLASMPMIMTTLSAFGE